ASTSRAMASTAPACGPLGATRALFAISPAPASPAQRRRALNAPRTRGSELVLAGAGRCVGGGVHRDLVVAGLDLDRLRHRLRAALGPGLELVLARLEAAEAEGALAVGDRVVRGLHHDDRRAH